MTSKIIQRNYGRRGTSNCIHKLGDASTDLMNPPHPKDVMEKINTNGQIMIVPSRNPREFPKLFKTTEFNKIKGQAHVVTAKDKMALIEEAEARREQKEKESNSRKEELKNAQKLQLLKQGKRLTKMESEANEKTNYLLKRAFDLRQEQEDEVKQANKLILASKCLAIRAAQLKEKELIEKEMEEEEKRLQKMMEEQRRISLQNEDAKRQEERKKNQKFVKQMKEQMKEKEIERLQEGERLEEEAKMQNKALIQMVKEEAEERQAKLKEQERMREDLVRANQEIARFKQVEKEENRISSLRVQEFMRKKAEREEAIEEEKRKAKIAKEMETARLLAMQEKQADLQAARDEMNALRVQEEVERAWRKKEKDAAEKRKNDAINLKIARNLQMEDIRKQQAMELEKEKQQFFKIIMVQKADLEKEKEKQEKRRQEILQHKKEILLQVNEKEREKINIRKEKFEEGLALRAEQEIRERHIKRALTNKMSKLRQNKVPESVVKDIERQLKL